MKRHPCVSVLLRREVADADGARTSELCLTIFFQDAPPQQMSS